MTIAAMTTTMTKTMRTRSSGGSVVGVFSSVVIESCLQTQPVSPNPRPYPCDYDAIRRADRIAPRLTIFGRLPRSESSAFSVTRAYHGVGASPVGSSGART